MGYRPNQPQTNPYNPYADIQKIYDYKNNWQQANKNKNQSGMKTATEEAKKYYASLRNNGYSNVADSLAKSNYDQSKAIHDYYAMFGKTATRPYLYSKAEAYGKTQADVDKLINWNDATGQITFGGQLIGTPDTISSTGVSYWNDTSALDKAFEAEAKNRGWTRTSNNLYNENIQGATDMNNAAAASINSYDTQSQKDISAASGFIPAALEMYRNLGQNRQAQFNYANQDVTKTDEWKAAWNNIVPDYKYASDQAALNAAADAASTNSGNIDSFAAANARRQREASLAKGQRLAAEMGLAAYQGRVGAMDTTNNNARNDVLAGGQVYNDFMDGIYKQALTSASYTDQRNATAQSYRDTANTITDNNSKEAQNKLYEADTWKTIAEITGKVPSELSGSSNIFLNNDGSLKDEYKDTDFSDVLAWLRANNKDGKNDSMIQQAQEARGAKGFNNPDTYGQYLADGDFAIPGSSATLPGAQTESGRQFDKQIENAENMVKLRSDADIALAREQSANKIAEGHAAADDAINVGGATSANKIAEGHAAADDAIKVGGAESANKIAETNNDANNASLFWALTGTTLSGDGSTTSGSKKINSSGNITQLSLADYNKLIDDLNKVRTKDWGYDTGMFDKGSDGNYKLNTNKATVESVIDQLYNKGYSEDLIERLFKVWGVSDGEYLKGIGNWQKKYVDPVVGG
ncbi:MAG: hypothetical protein J1G06_09895 [Oscillospiraceae bacterium]|nr:hypothetical protein [Oscillospiraceae bacterium]